MALVLTLFALQGILLLSFLLFVNRKQYEEILKWKKRSRLHFFLGEMLSLVIAVLILANVATMVTLARAYLDTIQ